MRKWAGFAPGSTALIITGAGASVADSPYPLRITTNVLGTIPEGDYTGNAVDAIEVQNESPHYDIEVDDTIRARGVPYQIGGGGGFGLLNVEGAAGPTLTIEPGVILRFYSSPSSVGGLFVGDTGSATPLGQIVAVGTALAPIVFTDGGDIAGWEGITFSGALASGNQLTHVRIENAGLHGGDNGFGCPPEGLSFSTDAALKLFTQPAASFFTQSVIADSSAHGVYSAWNGAAVDFMASNSFVSVAGCQQVAPKDTNGTCPADPSCQ